VLHDRTKHIDIRYHFVRELVENMQISVVYIETKKMIADLLTKAVSRVVHDTLVGQLFGWMNA
jgi:ribosomal protein L7Ae-like RNA K-turn-binding protein